MSLAAHAQTRFLKIPQGAAGERGSAADSGKARNYMEASARRRSSTTLILD